MPGISPRVEDPRLIPSLHAPTRHISYELTPFYYLVGNSTCHQSLVAGLSKKLASLSAERTWRILLCGVGDIRNVLNTARNLRLAHEQCEGARMRARLKQVPLEFHLNDWNVSILARDLILLTVAAERTRSPRINSLHFLSLWANLSISSETRTLLNNTIDRLLSVFDTKSKQGGDSALDSDETFDKLGFDVSIPFALTRRQVCAVLKAWRREKRSLKVIHALRAKNFKQYAMSALYTRNSSGDGVTMDSPLAGQSASKTGAFMTQTNRDLIRSTPHKAELHAYFSMGSMMYPSDKTSRTNLKGFSLSTSELNPMFLDPWSANAKGDENVESLRAEEYWAHYGTNPFRTFPLEPDSTNPLFTQLYSKISGLLDDFRACVERTSFVVFSRNFLEMPAALRDCGLSVSYDVIDTSNLADNAALSSILVSMPEILRKAPESMLLTESMKVRQVDSSMNADKLLRAECGVSLQTLPTVYGLTCEEPSFGVFGNATASYSHNPSLQNTASPMRFIFRPVGFSRCTSMTFPQVASPLPRRRPANSAEEKDSENVLLSVIDRVVSRFADMFGRVKHSCDKYVPYVAGITCMGVMRIAEHVATRASNPDVVFRYLRSRFAEDNDLKLHLMEFDMNVVKRRALFRSLGRRINFYPDVYEPLHPSLQGRDPGSDVALLTFALDAVIPRPGAYIVHMLFGMTQPELEVAGMLGTTGFSAGGMFQSVAAADPNWPKNPRPWQDFSVPNNLQRILSFTSDMRQRKAQLLVPTQLDLARVGFLLCNESGEAMEFITCARGMLLSHCATSQAVNDLDLRVLRDDGSSFYAEIAFSASISSSAQPSLDSVKSGEIRVRLERSTLTLHLACDVVVDSARIRISRKRCLLMLDFPKAVISASYAGDPMSADTGSPADLPLWPAGQGVTSRHSMFNISEISASHDDPEKIKDPFYDLRQSIVRIFESSVEFFKNDEESFKQEVMAFLISSNKVGYMLLVKSMRKMPNGEPLLLGMFTSPTMETIGNIETVRQHYQLRQDTNFELISVTATDEEMALVTELLRKNSRALQRMTGGSIPLHETVAGVQFTSVYIAPMYPKDLFGIAGDSSSSTTAAVAASTKPPAKKGKTKPQSNKRKSKAKSKQQSASTSASPSAKPERTCGACAKALQNPKALKCSACKAVYYCNRDCQRAHWKVHKKMCGKK